MEKEYIPNPVDTSGVELSEDLAALGELLAENTHEVWAQGRASEGWTWGPQRDDGRKLHPCLKPYADLPEGEKAYDRATSMETLKVIQALGWRLVPPEA